MFLHFHYPFNSFYIDIRTHNKWSLTSTDGWRKIDFFSLIIFIQHTNKVCPENDPSWLTHCLNFSIRASNYCFVHTVSMCSTGKKDKKCMCLSLCCYKWEQTLTHVWEKKERNFNRIITFTGYSMEYKNILFLVCISYVCSIQNMKKWQFIISYFSLICV